MTSAADRERLWDAEAARAVRNGRGQYPVCNLCDSPIGIGQDWDESHIGRPKALGGALTGCAHRRCNRDHNNRFVTPSVAKAKRQARVHKGCKQTATPLPFGRNTSRSKKLNGEVVARQTQGQKLAETLARRRIG